MLSTVNQCFTDPLVCSEFVCAFLRLGLQLAGFQGKDPPGLLQDNLVMGPLFKTPMYLSAVTLILQVS